MGPREEEKNRLYEPWLRIIHIIPMVKTERIRKEWERRLLLPDGTHIFVLGRDATHRMSAPTVLVARIAASASASTANGDTPSSDAASTSNASTNGSM
jgi:hypothetical protein